MDAFGTAGDFGEEVPLEEFGGFGLAVGAVFGDGFLRRYLG